MGTSISYEDHSQKRFPQVRSVMIYPGVTSPVRGWPWRISPNGSCVFQGTSAGQLGCCVGVESADSHRERGLTDSFVLLGANMWSQALIVTCRPKSLWIKCRPLL